MANYHGSTYEELIRAGWVDSVAVAGVAEELGIRERTVEEWRSWGVIPTPTRAGNQGKTPRWLYPPQTAEQLRAASAYKPTKRIAEPVKVALWIDGFPFSNGEIRAAIVTVVRAWEQGLLKDLRRHAPEGTSDDGLRTDGAILATAVDGLANELARKRSSTLPLPRQVRLSLPERVRGMRYALSGAVGLQRDDADAILSERVFGMSRGRSAKARGITWSPDVSIPEAAPWVLREAVERADDLAMTMVKNALQIMAQLQPELMDVAIPPMSPLRPFADGSKDVIESSPLAARAMIAAYLFVGIERSRHTAELTPELVAAMEPDKMREELRRLRDAQD